LFQLRYLDRDCHPHFSREVLSQFYRHCLARDTGIAMNIRDFHAQGMLAIACLSGVPARKFATYSRKCLRRLLIQTPKLSSRPRARRRPRPRESECLTIRLTEQNNCRTSGPFPAQNANAPRTSTTTRTRTIPKFRNLGLIAKRGRPKRGGSIVRIHSE